jgi:hypothetical protein
MEVTPTFETATRHGIIDDLELLNADRRLQAAAIGAPSRPFLLERQSASAEPGSRGEG